MACSRARTGNGDTSIFRGAERWWKVNFEHEHITDAGGGFRETVCNIADDLNSRRTPLFIPTPNQESDEGDIRDAWCDTHSSMTCASHAVAVCLYSYAFIAVGLLNDFSVIAGCQIQLAQIMIATNLSVA